LKRPIRPASYEIQPTSIEPTETDKQEATAIACLIGYIAGYLGATLKSGGSRSNLDTYSFSQCVGEVMVWQLAAWGDREYLPVMRLALQQSSALPSHRLREQCLKGLPTLRKHQHVLSADGKMLLERIAIAVAKPDSAG